MESHLQGCTSVKQIKQISIKFISNKKKTDVTIREGDCEVAAHQRDLGTLPDEQLRHESGY